MNKKRYKKMGEITVVQLLIVVIAALLTWLGMNYYNKLREKQYNDEGTIISLPYKGELDKLKVEYEELKKKLEEKGNTIISLEQINKEKDKEIISLNNLGTETANLREELFLRNKELESSKKELDSANNRISQLNDTNKSLGEGIKKAKEGLEKAHAVITVLSKQNTAYKEERKIIGTVRTKIKESVRGYSGDTDFKSKYVVLTQNVTVELSQNEVSTLLGITVGNADLRVTYIDNKVQYYVDLESLSDQDVQYDMDRRSINIYVASPKLDEDMVEVQSNPEKIIKKDNSSWITYGIDIEKMKDDALAKVRREVLEAGSHDMYKASARRNAKEKLYELFKKVLKGYLEEKNLDLNIIVYD